MSPDTVNTAAVLTAVGAATTIAVSDPSAGRVHLARSMGATHAISSTGSGIDDRFVVFSGATSRGAAR